MANESGNRPGTNVKSWVSSRANPNLIRKRESTIKKTISQLMQEAERIEQITQEVQDDMTDMSHEIQGDQELENIEKGLDDLYTNYMRNVNKGTAPREQYEGMRKALEEYREVAQKLGQDFEKDERWVRNELRRIRRERQNLQELLTKVRAVVQELNVHLANPQQAPIDDIIKHTEKCIKWAEKVLRYQTFIERYSKREKKLEQAMNKLESHQQSLIEYLDQNNKSNHADLIR